MVDQIPLDDPLKCKNAEVWDQETVNSFLKKNCFFQGNLLYVLNINRNRTK